MGAMANIYNGITNHCNDGEIVMMLDGGDSFIGRQVMSTFNAVYYKTKAGMVYSQHLKILSDTIKTGRSAKIPKNIIKRK